MNFRVTDEQRLQEKRTSIRPHQPWWWHISLSWKFCFPSLWQESRDPLTPCSRLGYLCPLFACWACISCCFLSSSAILLLASWRRRSSSILLFSCSSRSSLYFSFRILSSADVMLLRVMLIAFSRPRTAVICRWTSLSLILLVAIFWSRSLSLLILSFSESWCPWSIEVRYPHHVAFPDFSLSIILISWSRLAISPRSFAKRNLARRKSASCFCKRFLSSRICNVNAGTLCVLSCLAALAEFVAWFAWGAVW